MRTRRQNPPASSHHFPTRTTRNHGVPPLHEPEREFVTGFERPTPQAGWKPALHLGSGAQISNARAWNLSPSLSPIGWRKRCPQGGRGSAPDGKRMSRNEEETRMSASRKKEPKMTSAPAQNDGDRMASAGRSGQRCTRAPPPFMSFSTSPLSAIEVSPGVVMASAP